MKSAIQNRSFRLIPQLELTPGDHRHVGTVEAPYVFSTPDQLMADFNADIARWNHENGRS
jgi:hypothetical protein